MSDNYLYLDAAFVKAEIAKLIEANPELAEDDTLRFDMIEGETGAVQIIERALAEQQGAEMMVGAVKAREIDLAARRGRYERKSEAMRSLIKSIMRAANLDRLTLTEATLSLTKARQTVGIEDLEALPQGYFRTTRQADKAAIKSALEQGEEIPGAFLVTGDTGLTIRTK
ncbi:siphovirus Gp157 family protein [Mesorhizobium sp. BR1-1-9]|uniref:siphovirus Gp157 family protein n=1 Tax=Mesorhizobium sp. BR1-1-9 TaxID=2876646 RepID=UPI001CD13738|nr:siphovirus Gp157 family protein [Mesorhizobium sp. BR1-1-9]MBZ9873118.1 siphovirus Gp157 family protein [Mesorhizobium sp. BR1-1-9]